MNELTVAGLGKKFYRKWVFKDLSFTVKSGERLLIKGPNGSGKSTLAKIISGKMTFDSGSIILESKGFAIPSEQFYQHISWAGPYFELYPDLTLTEMVDLHFRFRDNLVESKEQVIERLKLKGQEEKQIRNFSSGMTARLINGLAILSRSKLLILDEPTANLDEENRQLVLDLLDEFLGDRALIFISNDPNDFKLFEQVFDLKTVIQG